MVHTIVLGRTVDELEELGTKGSVLIAKQYIKMGERLSLANPIHLDVVKPHVMLIAGKRGGGKSYTMSVIAEGMAMLEPEIFKNIGVLMVDTMGIFWTMKYPNYRQDFLLKEWGLEPKGFEKKVRVLVPKGHYDEYKNEGLPVDEPFAIPVKDLEAADWVNVFELEQTSQEAVLITNVITRMRNNSGEYSIQDIIRAVESDEDSLKETKLVVKSLFLTAEAWGLFDEKGTSVTQLVKGGFINVLDVSPYAHAQGGGSIRALVVGLISKRILEERMKARKVEELKDIERGWSFFDDSYDGLSSDEKEVPLVWIFIDEAHEMLPREGETAASAALIQLLREGRQPGISLVLATQQPGKIHTDVMTQSDIVLSTRVTSKMDVEALNHIMQSYLPGVIGKYFEMLPARKGAAIILDDKMERLYPVQIRPKHSWHGGRESSAIKTKS